MLRVDKAKMNFRMEGRYPEIRSTLLPNTVLAS
jgi:hypothetical protein